MGANCTPSGHSCRGEVQSSLNTSIWSVAQNAIHLSKYALIETALNGELRFCRPKSHSFIEISADRVSFNRDSTVLTCWCTGCTGCCNISASANCMSVSPQVKPPVIDHRGLTELGHAACRAFAATQHQMTLARNDSRMPMLDGASSLRNDADTSSLDMGGVSNMRNVAWSPDGRHLTLSSAVSASLHATHPFTPQAGCIWVR